MFLLLIKKYVMFLSVVILAIVLRIFALCECKMYVFICLNVEICMQCFRVSVTLCSPFGGFSMT
jgi:hypothetical protein